MLKTTTKPLRRIVLIEEGQAKALKSSTRRTHTSGIFVKQVVFLTVNHCGLLPLRELHSTGETMMRGDPGGSWACLPPVYDYEWNHTATCCHICRTRPQKQSAEHAPKNSWEKRRDLQKAEKKKLVSSRIFTFRQPYRVTSGWIIHSQLLYTRAKQ